jgi:hypothetical protein
MQALVSHDRISDLPEQSAGLVPRLAIAFDRKRLPDTEF